MGSYIVRRLLYMILILFLVSIVSFVIIQLPPGDYLTTLVTNLRSRGILVGEEELQTLERRYGLDQPLYAQYAKWIWNFLHGDFGRSFQWNEPVSVLIAERLPLTVLISVLTLLFIYAVAIPIGIY